MTNTDSSGAGSLLAAIQSANLANDLDEIVFQAGLSGSIDLLAGATISEPVTITGPGSGALTVSTSCNTGCDSLFTVSAGSDAVTINELTLDSTDSSFDAGLIRHTGNATLNVQNSVLANSGGHSLSGYGGAIFANNGPVNIQNSTISGHLKSSHGGAAIFTHGVDLSIQNSILNNNNAPTGGAIWQRFGGSLSIQSSTLNNNNATNGDGGAIHATGNTALLIEDSLFNNNTASHSGGGLSFGIDNPSDVLELAIDSTVISNNEVGHDGGGIAVHGSNSPTNITISNSTINGNSNDSSPAIIASGGGVYIYGLDVDFDVVNSTFSGNSILGNCTHGGGGAIAFLGGSTATPFDADFLNVTISGNSTTSVSGCGGGISTHIDDTDIDVTIVNSIIADNTAASAPDLNAQAGVTNVDYSLIGDNSGANLTEITASNIIGSSAAPADPMLAALADNGGVQVGANADVALPTHAIQSGSAVIGAADQSASNSPLTLPATDQRGSGFDRVRDGGLDMGAIESIASVGSGSSGPTSSVAAPVGSGGGGGVGGPAWLFGLLSLCGLRRRR